MRTARDEQCAQTWRVNQSVLFLLMIIHNAVMAETQRDNAVTQAALRLQSQLLATVEQLSNNLDEDKSTEDGEPSIDQRFALIKTTSPLFAQLRGIARRAHEGARRGKKRVAEARTEVDHRSLTLQNLKYQKRHLEDEIRQCKDFQSVYQTIALVELDEFSQRAPQEERESFVMNDAHALQLARLRFELSERKRLEEEKKGMQTRRAALAKENKTKKQRLEGLESDLKEMLSRSVQVRQRFEEGHKEIQDRQKEGQDQSGTPMAEERTPKEESAGATS